MTPRDKADRCLRDIAVCQGLLQEIQRQAEAEMAAVRSKYEPRIQNMTGSIAANEAELKHLTKKHRAEILAGADRADLPSGSVMLKIELRVKRARDMLARLLAAGLESAIKRPKPVVDWDAVDKLDTATLTRLNAEKKRTEHFSYELKRS